MTCTLVLPVKPFAEGKSRLAPMLEAVERASLARNCFLHVLATVRAGAPDVRLEVHSRCPEVLRLAGNAGVAEDGQTLIDVLEAARGRAIRRADAHFMVLFADLPLITASDVQDLVRATIRSGFVLCPDRAGSGTNALGLSLGVNLPFLFGQDSFARFGRAASALGYSPERLVTAGLATDLDTPEDLVLIRQHQGAIALTQGARPCLDPPDKCGVKA
ncbi:MAG TPA: 2-phospho-L-lactate guanylyltransferase [Pedomonas sp.]|uniref:2-phospho-L-lactate guanylyltransferase n=1 Tax=Pedomonas sp. TaxID=2976421 RepID=UPI002F401183